LEIKKIVLEIKQTNFGNQKKFILEIKQTNSLEIGKSFQKSNREDNNQNIYYFSDTPQTP